MRLLSPDEEYPRFEPVAPTDFSAIAELLGALSSTKQLFIASPSATVEALWSMAQHPSIATTVCIQDGESEILRRTSSLEQPYAASQGDLFDTVMSAGLTEKMPEHEITMALSGLKGYLTKYGTLALCFETTTCSRQRAIKPREATNHLKTTIKPDYELWQGRDSATPNVYRYSPGYIRYLLGEVGLKTSNEETLVTEVDELTGRSLAVILAHAYSSNIDTI